MLEVTSYFNGAAYGVRVFNENNKFVGSVFFQGDDALEFEERIFDVDVVTPLQAFYDHGYDSTLGDHYEDQATGGVTFNL